MHCQWHSYIPGHTRASLHFAQASENVVHTGTQENTAFYDINCSPYHRHTPDIAAPNVSDTAKNATSPTLTGDFPVQRLFRHVGARVLLLLEYYC